VPVILGDDGQKLSKRKGAVSVTAYEEEGFLPEAMLNYLARLGWSHGDEELFSRAQMIEWFDGSHLARHPAQWDAAKLAWVNAHYLKALGDEALLALARRQLARRGIAHEAMVDEQLLRAATLFRDRCNTGAELAGWLAMLFEPVEASVEERARHLTDDVRPAFATLAGKLETVAWDAAGIAAAVKETLAAHGLKMGQLAPAVRVAVCGRAQTPSLDAVLALFPRQVVRDRLRKAAEAPL